MARDNGGIPHAPELELAVLGALFADERAISRVVESVGPETFFEPRNRLVFEAARRVHGRGDGLDPPTLADELRASGDLERAGGFPRLAELLDAVPSASGVETHCGLLREYEALRRVIRVSGEVADSARKAKPGEVRAILDRAEAEILSVARTADRGEYTMAADLIMPFFDELARRQSAPGEIAGLSTGLSALDRALSGLRPGQLLVPAGRPSMGKTALVTGWALHNALEEEVPVGFFTAELSEMQLVERMVSVESHVPYRRLLDGRLSPEEEARVVEAAGRIKTAAIAIDDRARSTLEVRSRARRMHAEKGVGVLFVDYLQLLHASDPTGNREQEVSAISRALKGLARELEIPVVAIAQLSRGPEHRKEKRPVLSDLRDSGAIEQDADVVLFVFREEQYLDPKSERFRDVEGKTELIIAKQRNGPTRTVEARFYKPTMRFESAVTQGGLGV